MRFEILRRDAASAYHDAISAGTSADEAERTREKALRQLDDDEAFVALCNRGGEFISEEHAQRIRALAVIAWSDGHGKAHPLLSEDEVYNLLTPRGTLNPKERKIIEDHAVHTYNMLSQIPFPRSLTNVTEYAAGHHERIDGKGYPRGLTGDQLSIPARIVAIADIFEALTAPDRPYRKPGTLRWAIDIMQRMKQDRHIDADLFDLFLAEKIPDAYARQYLTVAQLDGLDT
jgi:hypothetical protein